MSGSLTNSSIVQKGQYRKEIERELELKQTMNFWRSVSKLLQNSYSQFTSNLLLPQTNNLLLSFTSRGISLNSMHKKGPPKKVHKGNKVMEGRPFLKGVVLKTLIKKPRKPNSANRKCVLVKLSTGKEAIAFVPGVGHNLQEHQFVLVRGGRLKDVPGVKVRCVRGVYDLPHVGK